MSILLQKPAQQTSLLKVMSASSVTAVCVVLKEQTKITKSNLVQLMSTDWLTVD